VAKAVFAVELESATDLSSFAFLLISKFRASCEFTAVFEHVGNSYQTIKNLLYKYFCIE